MAGHGAPAIDALADVLSHNKYVLRVVNILISILMRKTRHYDYLLFVAAKPWPWVMATSSERQCFLEVGSTDDGDITLYPLHLLSRSSFCTHCNAQHRHSFPRLWQPTGPRTELDFCAGYSDDHTLSVQSRDRRDLSKQTHALTPSLSSTRVNGDHSDIYFYADSFPPIIP